MAKQEKKGGKQAIDGATRKTIFVVPVGDLSVYPDWHPRYDPRSSYTPEPAMVANVRNRGIQKPLRVEVVKQPVTLAGRDGKDHKLPAGIYVVDGHQRRAWALAAEAEAKKDGEPGATVHVPVWPITGDDDYLLSLSIALNHHVEDDPIVMAKKLRIVHDRLGGDVRRTAVETGHAESFVKQHLALLGLAAPVQVLVQRGQVSIGTAFDVSKLPIADQAAAVQTAMAAGQQGDGRRRTTVTRAQVRQAVGGSASKAPTKAQIRKRLAEVDVIDTPGDRIRAEELRWVLTGSRK